MSKSTIGLRKVGISTLAVAMSLGVAGVTASAANAAAGDYTASGSPNVTQGMNNQAAGDLSYEFTNNFNTNSKVTFTVASSAGPNTCATADQIKSDIYFSSKPTVTLTDVDANKDGKSATQPNYTVTLDSADANCNTVGVYDRVTVTLTSPSAGDAGDDFVLNLSGVKYNVGSTAATGNVSVTAAAVGTTPAPTPNPVVNAVVVNKSFMFVPLVSATPNSAGAQLGTATYSESTPGAYFAPGDNTVTLTVTGGTFTPGITPTIKVPAGYTVSNGTTNGAPKTTDPGTSTYTFHVTAPVNPVAATVTVSGLEFDAGATPVQGTLSSSVQQPAVTVSGVTSTPAAIKDSSPAVNVVNYGPRDRIGGANRYDTAARLFRQGNYGSNSVVLASGQNFPDALSANYLAGELGTGTLLTKTDSLPDVTMNAILDTNVDTVYIVGGTGAVSKAVQNQLESTHIGGDVNNPYMVNVVRLGGANRYATNQRINQWTDTNYNNSGTVLLANGTTPYDALAGGPVSYENGDPVVLTGNNGLDRGEEQELIDLGADTVVILGDTGVVSQAEEDALKADGYTVVRLGGATRYGTAAAIATWASEGYDFDGNGTTGNTTIEQSQGFDAAEAAITTGKGFADALAAAPYVGSNGIPMVLSQGADSLSGDTADYLAGKTVGIVTDGTNVGTLLALGQTGATSNSMIEDAAKSIETK